MGELLEDRFFCRKPAPARPPSISGDDGGLVGRDGSFVGRDGSFCGDDHQRGGGCAPHCLLKCYTNPARVTSSPSHGCRCWPQLLAIVHHCCLIALVPIGV